MSENTPKLDLLMKDPVLDGHEYFNVKTMMNDNWEKIDAFADTVDREVKELQQRLDTEQRKEITLQPGLQIIESDKTVPFHLTGLKGRTLVNLLGRRGSMDSLTGWSTTSGTSAVIDTTLKSQGTGSAKVTITGTNGTLYMPLNGIVDFTKHHLIVADLRKGDSTHVSMSFWNGTGNYGLKTVTASTFTPTFILVPPNQFNVSGTNNLQISVNGATGQYSYADAVRVYAISADEYAALGNMSAEQIAAKYPYVDSVKPVRNPYVIRYGENLLPSFYEWTSSSSTSLVKVLAPYSGVLNASKTINEAVYVDIKLLPNTTYTMSCTSGRLFCTLTLINGTSPQRFITDDGGSVTFTTPTDISSARLQLLNLVSYTDINNPNTFVYSAGTYTMVNPILSVGSEVLPFVPREDSMLALQTDLYADPLTGDNADSVYERDGQYYKNKIWNRVLLDGTWPWTLGSSPTGYKLVYTNMTAPYNPTMWNPAGVKYDGKILNRTGGADNLSGNAGGTLVQIGISNLDSGWGDNYNDLTADEIKAFFMGWRMRDQVTTAPFNGGVKAWGSLMSGGTDYYTNTLPTTVAPDFRVPYELVYQLATPTTEPIVSEGQLAVNEGSNQVEVGTGIVLRENAQAAKDAGGKWNLGNTAASATAVGFKNVASKVLNVYENGREDAGWIKASIAQEITAGDTYNQEAAYSVTYLMRDTSPAVPFVGSVSDNEKTLLSDLVQDMQQTLTRVSVVENKKAENDSPAWIVPIFLNGWVAYGSGSRSGFLKRSDGVVMVEIIAMSGADNSTVFILPPGYRPSQTLQRAGLTSNGTTRVPATVDILPDGRVNVYGTYTTALNLAFSFLAK